MSNRFHAPDLVQAGRYVLGEAEARHLIASRLEVGSRIWLFDGRSPEAREAAVIARGRKGVTVEFTGATDGGAREPAHHFTLATCAPKGARLDWLVEKSVEIGVSRIQFMNTERSVVDPRPRKQERLRKLVVEASKQCGRNRLMELAPPLDFLDFLRDCNGPAKWIAHPHSTSPEAGKRPDSADTPASVCAIGPEGGFTDGELDLAIGDGWLPITLARAILRIETAAIIAAALALAPYRHQKDLGSS